MLPAEMEDSIPVSSSTDWSAAFGFKNKEPPDDDLGILYSSFSYFASSTVFICLLSPIFNKSMYRFGFFFFTWFVIPFKILILFFPLSHTSSVEETC